MPHEPIARGRVYTTSASRKAGLGSKRLGLSQDAKIVKKTLPVTNFGQSAVGMPRYRQAATLRVEVFLCGAILGRPGHRTVLHLSSAWGGLEKRNPLFDKLLHYEIPTSRKLDFEPNTAR
jgi:hypothetical protein